MSTYYKAPPHRPLANSEQATQPRESLAALDVTDRSIYIFPTPSSLPTTPGGSSDFSAPSDFTDLSDSAARSRNISTSISTHASTSTSPASRRSRLSSGTVPSDPEVEVWEWQSDARDESHGQDEYWDYEEEIERVGQWDVLSHRLTEGMPLRTRPLSAPSFPCTNDFIDQHYRAFLRSRTRSNISSLTSNSRGSNRPIFTPHPRIHIPLLSFFASLLFLDLEDPALRLLTQSSADSVLFPGQPNVSPPDDENESSSVPRTSTDDIDTELAEPHGLLRLFVNGLQPPAKTIKDGIAVAFDPSFSTPNLFGIPGLNSLQKFGQFIGNTWYRGGQAWQEIRLDDDTDFSS